MAQLLVAGRWTLAGPLGAYLEAALPDDYWVVVDPVVRRQTFDAVVIGPGGLTIVRAVRRPPAAAVPPAPPDDPAEERPAAVRALAAFLDELFPALRPRVDYLQAVPPGVDTTSWTVVEPAAMRDQDLSQGIIATQGEPAAGLADSDRRAAIGTALRDQAVTPGQRTAQPFVFRRGGVLGNAVRAWTIRDAVAHMDRHPEDGIYHLQNGTLADWLAAEGADEQAALARDVVHQTHGDPRVALEEFLIGTGLVSRPRLVVRPPVIDLGYILAGETNWRRVRLETGRGRGYLFGTVVPGEYWLDAEPRAFAGKSSELAVRADTSNLRISPVAYQSDLRLASSASAEPICVPVRFTITAQPSAVSRHFVRPLALAALAGAFGGLAGLAIQSLGAAAPLGDYVLQANFWPVALAMLWAFVGAICGLRQPPAWPVRYAAVRWLGWLALWGVLLPALALLMTAAWNRASISNRGDFTAGDQVTAALLALACAAFPAAVVHLLTAWDGYRTPGAPRGRSRWRLVLVPAVAILLVASLLAGAPAVRPAWQQTETQGTVTLAGRVANALLDRLSAAAGAVLDRVYLRVYDRRAPAEATPAAAPDLAPEEPVVTDTP